ncbi:hypothetical protein [Nocardiopsis deserti]|uniref:hypothetical protein n=1 Tax=Nocardiopsis deserti TaxID=2605988 RepID=UPI001239C1F7|nr:hypothetical protein [Nocardiopsis deserti]
MAFLRFLARYRVGVRTWILGTAAMLGLSGDYIGTLEGSVWYQRVWMIVLGLVILSAHVGVEMLSTREDRRLARALEEAHDRLEEARDDLQELRAQKEELQESVGVLKQESEIYRAELAESARESDGLAWLVSSQGRAALDGLRGFAERLVTAHGPDEARQEIRHRHEAVRQDATERSTVGRVVLRVALQVLVGLLSAAFLGLLILGIEIYLD